MSSKPGSMQWLVFGGSWLLALLLVSWIYSPGLAGPLLLDDWENLKVLEKIEHEPEHYLDVVRENISGPSGRPISMLSFALEKRYFDRGIYGQKQLGLVLHLLNATLVLVLIYQLCRVTHRPLHLPLLLAVSAFWLATPLFVSTTLYIVQRMTLLSASFGLMAIVSYLKARRSLDDGGKGLAWFSLAAVFLTLSSLSKENGLLILPILVALEYGVLRRRADTSLSFAKVLTQSIAAVIVLVAAVSILLIFQWPDWVFSGYARREFTAYERLLTESRALWHYVIQFFWPDIHSLGVYHDDYPASRGLTEPISTLVALIAWSAVCALTILCFFFARFRLFAFGLSIFLIGHSMESTLLPLELYFEHRNYFPMVGLVIAVYAIGADAAINAVLAPWITLLLSVLMLRNVVHLGSQSIVWSNNGLLHIEAINYHPDSPRALYEAGRVYTSFGASELGLELAQKAMVLDSSSEVRRAVILARFYCLQNAPLPQNHWEDLNIVRSDTWGRDFSYQFSALVDSVIDGRCPSLDRRQLAKNLNTLVIKADLQLATPRMIGSLMFLENENENFRQALEYARLLYQAEPEEVLSLQFQLYLSSLLGLQENREWALQELLKRQEKGLLSREEQYNLELFLQE